MGFQEEPQDVAQLKLGEKKAQFRLLRRLSYAVEGLLLIVLVYIVWVQAGGTLGDGRPGTLFVPLPQVIFVFLLGALLFNITAVAFGAFEVDAASGGQQKYLIARHGFQTGLATVAFAVVFLVLIAILGPVIDGQIDFENQIELGYRSSSQTTRAPFNVTSDYTGSSYLNWVEINSTNARLMTVQVFRHQDFSNNESADSGKEIILAEGVTYFWFSFPSLEIQTRPALNHTSKAIIKSRFDAQKEDLNVDPENGKYYVVIDRKDYEPAVITYHQDRLLDPGFTGSIFWMLISLMVVNGAGTGYNFYERNKWRAWGEKNY